MSEATGQKHTDKEYKYKFNGKYADGSVSFRHDTEQSLEYVKDYLDLKNIKYDIEIMANMLWVYHESKTYYYYYTTGRWARYYKGHRPDKHYRSKGIVDFITRFVLEKTDD